MALFYSDVIDVDALRRVPVWPAFKIGGLLDISILVADVTIFGNTVYIGT